MDQDKKNRSNDERPGGLSKPSVSWEDLEARKLVQLTLFTSFPTLAERAFLLLAHKWYAEIEENPYILRSADILALSCLLLAVEWGSKFTDMAREWMETNRKAAAAHNDASWYDQLLWELCQVPFMMVSPPETAAVKKLTANLDHHNSSIRYWMMEIGWFVRRWLAPSEAIPLLLKNLADTLKGPYEAAGLAVCVASSSAKFWNLANDFKPSDARFSEQYADRLKIVKQEGFLMTQASFLDLEAWCRKMIGDEVLGLRLVPPETLAGK